MDRTRIVAVFGSVLFGAFIGPLIKELLTAQNDNTLLGYGAVMGLGLGLMRTGRSRASK